MTLAKGVHSSRPEIGDPIGKLNIDFPAGGPPGSWCAWNQRRREQQPECMRRCGYDTPAPTQVHKLRLLEPHWGDDTWKRSSLSQSAAFTA